MPETFTLLQDLDRYPRQPGNLRAHVWPEKIVVHGTLEQARHVAAMLSFDEPGCTDYWYVEGDPDA